MNNKISSDKQKEITKAVLEWLKKIGYNKSYEALLEESGTDNNDVPNKNILESKWSTILLLHNKINELENQLKNFKEDIDKAKLNGTSYNLKKEGDNTMVIFYCYVINYFYY